MRLSLRLALLVLLASTVLVAVADPAAAHRQGLRAGYTRLLYDCAHDWGWESGRTNSTEYQFGHELVTLDVTERTEAGTPLLLFELNMVLANPGGAPPAYRTRETISFQTPRGHVTTTLDSSSEQRLDHVDGLRPHYLGPRKAGVSEGQGEDPVLMAFDVGYTYEQLRLQNGETITGYEVVAHYQDPLDGLAWKRGDNMAGGATARTGGYEPACRYAPNHPENDATYYVNPGYAVTRSDWRLATPGSQPPQAAFSLSPERPLAGQQVAFLDGSHDPDGDLASWTWDFGDGASATTRNPSHAYAAPGSYTVRLTATDATGLQATATRVVTVARPENKPPLAAFSWTPTQPRSLDEVRFLDESGDAEGALAAWAWEFGDGAALRCDPSGCVLPDQGGPGGVPSHVYARPGAYTVRLTVTDAEGARSTTTRTIHVANLPPAADFHATPKEGHVGQNVTFLDRSRDADGNVTGWTWDFGDGNSSRERSPSHAYAQAGAYRVRLEVRDEHGAGANASVEVVVAPPPQAPPPPARIRADRLEARTGEAIAFQAEAAEGEGLEWSWDLGDGNATTGPAAHHAYGRPGRYAVVLVVRDPTGATNATRVHVDVLNRPPEGDFLVDPPEPGEGDPVRVEDRAVDPDGVLAEVTWDWGDGHRATGPRASHAYASAGVYVVTRVAVDGHGAVHETRVEVRVPPRPNSPPVAEYRFNLSAPTALDTVLFQDASRDADGAIGASRWDFGDGTLAEGFVVEHRFPKAGVYVVRHVVVDDRGAEAAVSKRVVVANVPPRAAFSHDPPVAGKPVAFRSEATDPDGAIVAAEWHFPGQAPGYEASATRTFGAPGVYVVRLTVTDDGGETATIAREVVVKAPPEESTSAADSPSATRPIPLPPLGGLVALGLAGTLRRVRR